MKLLQQCFLFFIVVVIPEHNLGNSQVSVNRTIGPTLVFLFPSLSVSPMLCIGNCFVKDFSGPTSTGILKFHINVYNN